jgi:hypothetical protein
MCSVCRRFTYVMGFCLTALPLVTLVAQDARPKEGSDPRQEEINRAVDAGLALLKRSQQQDGSFAHQYALGMTSLCGWSMLEGGVSHKDPAMTKLVAWVRDNCLKSDFTYSISVAIIFLDRYGDPGDAPLIEALACQLLRQGWGTGAWRYACPEIPEEERKIFSDLAKKARDDGPGPQEPKDVKDMPKRRFSADGVRLLKKLELMNPLADPSATQFAMMALWVARRHGVPVDDTLRLVPLVFRKTQRPDGGWAYRFEDPNEKSTPAMTCAGLLAYALGHAVNKEKRDILKDARVVPAMKALRAFMDKLSKDKENFFLGEQGGNNYYFLWSLERMAVVYDIKKVGERDWYRWGADLLLDQAKANRDNLWQGAYGLADTSFAILFLKRANVAQDLTRQLSPLFNPILKKPK